MGLFLQGIASGGVVVACDVQRVQEGRGHRVDLLGVGALIHAAADERRHDVEGETGVAALFLGLVAAGLFAVLVEGVALGGAAHDHQVRAAGDRAGGVQLWQRAIIFLP